MKAEDWVSIIVAVIGVVGTVITSFHVKPAENIEKIVENIKTLKSIEADEENKDREKGTINNLWECVEHESKKLSPYPGWFGYLLVMWFVVSCVSSYFANDVNHIATTILISFIAIVFLCAFLWVFPRCKWGSETDAVACAYTFICGTIGTWIGGYECLQLANPNSTICDLIGPENVDAIGGLIGGLIGAAIGAAIGAIIGAIIGKGTVTKLRVIGVIFIGIFVWIGTAIAVSISGDGGWKVGVGAGAAIAVWCTTAIAYYNVYKKNTLMKKKETRADDVSEQAPAGNQSIAARHNPGCAARDVAHPQSEDSIDDIKVYPESASGYLINDLGKLLNMNPDLYARRIRRISPTATVIGLIVLCLVVSSLIPSDLNPVFQNLVSAFIGFLVGLAAPIYERFCKWAGRVNQTMENAEGGISIGDAIYQNSVFCDEGAMFLPRARVSPTWAQKTWIKIQFPSLSRKWRKYFRRGSAEPSLEPLPYLLIHNDSQEEQKKFSIRWCHWVNERECRKRFHYLESLSRCVFILEPYQDTLDYLLNYSCRIIGERIRKEKILKGYIPVGDAYVYKKNVDK